MKLQKFIKKFKKNKKTVDIVNKMYYNKRCKGKKIRTLQMVITKRKGLKNDRIDRKAKSKKI